MRVAPGDGKSIFDLTLRETTMDDVQLEASTRSDPPRDDLVNDANEVRIRQELVLTRLANGLRTRPFGRFRIWQLVRAIVTSMPAVDEGVVILPISG